jgi:phenylalanyl-tRNA synthetase beta chain
MKISLEWLSDFLPGPLDAQTAADALTRGGLPVEMIERFGDDTVIDVEVTSNRSDCLCHLGIARELASLLDRPLQIPHPQPLPPSPGNADPVTSVLIEAADLCQHYTARVISGVGISPSPGWMQRRLESVGLRPINNVVDVTNYVLFEMGQPLHTFDYDRLEGRRVIVRRGRPGEKLVTLDGREVSLSADMLTIADAVRPVALAGVMGGKDSEVTGATRNVLLESARFDPLSVRKTARALAMRSDSSYRFERGIDPTLPLRASRRAAQLIRELAGGEMTGGIVEAGTAGFTPKSLSLRLSMIRRVLGIEVPTDQVIGALSRLRLAPSLVGDTIKVTVPGERLDLNLEIDLVEEVARVIGYEQIPLREEISIRLAPLAPRTKVLDGLRSTLVACGYFESINFGWVSDLLADDFVPPEADPRRPLPRVDASVRKDNAHLRPSLLPGLLEAVRRNENAGTREPRLFEMGSVFWNDLSGRVSESRRLAVVGTTDVRDVRGSVETLLARLAAERPMRVIPDARRGFARGACGRIEWGGETLGWLGRIDRAAAEKLSLREPPAAAELDLSALLAGAQLVPQLRTLPRFPAVERDLSLVLSESVRYESVEALIVGLALPWLESLEYVTTYRGKPLEKGVKSVTVKLIFRSPAGTLTSEQVETSVTRAIETAKAQLGATVRS